MKKGLAIIAVTVIVTAALVLTTRPSSTLKRDTSWWNDDVIQQITRDVHREVWELEYHESGEGLIRSGGFWAYDREGNIAIIEGDLAYSVVPIAGAECWFMKIDLNNYQIVGREGF